MKKILILLTIASCLSMATVAQEESVVEKKAFVSINVGPSFPIGDFGSSNFDNDHAGYARIGVAFDLHGGYYFGERIGIAGSTFFSLYSFDEQRIKEQMVEQGLISQDASLTVDHWKYYGIVAGPTIKFTVARMVLMDISPMIGIANANSPKAISSESPGSQLSEDWAATIPIKVSAGMRVFFTGSMYLSGGMSYLFMEPEFSVAGNTMHQKISAVNVTMGVGVKF